VQNIVEPINVIQFNVPKGVRKNGFVCPIHPQQVAMYVMLLFDAGTYYGISMVSLAGTPVSMIIASVIYGIIALIAAISMYLL